MSSKNDKKTFLRRSIDGPFAHVFVGPDLKVFILPKASLCETSTYFEAALNGSSLEATEQRVELDNEDSDVFRTYVVWLYQRGLSSDDLNEAFPTAAGIEKHLIALYDFADRRGIDALIKDTYEMLASYFAVTGLAQIATLDYAFSLQSIRSRGQQQSVGELLLVVEMQWGNRSLEEIKKLPKEFKDLTLHALMRVRTEDLFSDAPENITSWIKGWADLLKDHHGYLKPEPETPVQEQESSRERKRKRCS